MLAPDVIPVGTIRRTHGKNGELQCHALNDAWENADAEFVFIDIDAIYVPFRVLDWRTKGAEDLIFQLKGVNSESAAERLVGREVYMLRSDLPAGTEDAPLETQDLIGARLIDTAQGDLGVIAAIDQSTANTLIELAGGRLLPLHEDFIVGFDNRTLTVTFPFCIND